MKKRRFPIQQTEKVLPRNYSLKILLTIGLTSVGVYADIPKGLIGGSTNSSNLYAAFISSTEELIPISNLPLNGQINGVALNNLGVGLIGGVDGSGGYAAFVSLDEPIHPLILNLPMGTISSTAINDNSDGLIGGNDDAAAYAALVSQDGTIRLLSTPSSGFIHSTALNNGGIGLIGGEGGSLPYAAYVIGGVAMQIDTTPLAGGHLNVAINHQGNGIIGGFSTLGAYAAFVSPDGALPRLLSPIPTGFAGLINGVAINDSGIALIGGHDDSANMYAGYSTADGAVTPLFGSPDMGDILSVAINSSGVGLIGGSDNANLYAAFAYPDYTIRPLFSGSIPGMINSVALNDAGVGLIGGQGGLSGYAALIAPNGTFTLFDMSNQINISSVALSITNAATPQSVGPYSSRFYMHLAAALALESRFVGQNRSWTKGSASQANIAQGELADNELNLYSEFLSNEEGESESHSEVLFPMREQPFSETKNTLWLSPFGNYIHLKAQGSLPTYTNEIGGALLGYDHQTSNHLMGVSLGYAFNYVGYSQGIGHSKLQEEMLCLYGAYYLNHFWLGSAVWGGLFQLSNVRHTLSIITSKASTQGWILSPHLELASPWAIDQKERCFIEPFCMFDWVNSWQDPLTEHGAAGLNLQMGRLYSSLLQSEVGLRFYEQVECSWGNVCLEEKLSYINQTPFHLNPASVSFVSSASSFPVAVGSSQVEHLGSAQLIGSFVPRNHSRPFSGFAIQATANGTYQSYFASVFIGRDF